jgi:hypothetical protein
MLFARGDQAMDYLAEGRIRLSVFLDGRIVVRAYCPGDISEIAALDGVAERGRDRDHAVA